MQNFNAIGNKAILNLHKTAFLCSRKVPADIILKSYDWAIERREKGNCIISGFHSQIEKDVFHYLLKGEQPVIIVLERYFKKRYTPFDREIKDALKANRLLIISQFGEKIKRASVKTAKKRNELMCNIADEIFIAHASKGGKIEALLKRPDIRNKKILSFDLQAAREHMCLEQ
jgi:predicted Rossmann fold nucleotide-binding protein DprA/Smf involved in DNA uptake